MIKDGRETEVKVTIEDDAGNLPDKNDQTTGSRETVSGVSSCSSPAPLEPFYGRYICKLLPKATSREGETTSYAIHSTRKADNEKFVVRRQYEDFEHLHHCLTVAAWPGDGLIISPLPVRQPVVQEISTPKKRLGQASKTLLCDDWRNDCFQLQEYLQSMVNHPMFGRSTDIWDKFLATADAPARIKAKRFGGLLNKITDSIENRGKSSHSDFDEYFKKERDYISNYVIFMREAVDMFNQRTQARLKLAAVLAHLSTALNLNLSTSDSDISKQGAKFFSAFSVGLDDYRKTIEAMAQNDEITLGSSLEFWSRMLEAEQEMLHRRTCLLVDYENANRSLDKAKPHKKESISPGSHSGLGTECMRKLIVDNVALL
ncbi:Sorting nexin-5 [Halotydeus destructor]|nr:Sorting nexin-5 [Halotydeus destructor]